MPTPSSGRWRAWWIVPALGALAAVLVALGVVGFATHAAPIVTDSDLAVGEVYVELATRGDLLVGPYSRLGWHHPGPFFFYLVSPFYAWSGHQAAAMYASALAINLAALAVMAWVMARESRDAAMATAIGICLLFIWRLPRFTASPWTAHVAVLPALAFVVIAAAVASGRLWLFPLLIVFGSFAAQTHVGFVPAVVAITASVAAIHLVSHRRGGPSPWPTLGVSAATGAVLWLLPVVEAVSHGGGNAAALWRFFVADASAGHSIGEALSYGSYGLAAMLRPGFELPWGGHVELSALPWSLACAGLEAVLLAVVARTAFAAGRRFEAYLALIALAATTIGFWGLTRIRGDILSHDLFRLAALGALNLGILAAAGLRAGSGLFGRWTVRPRVTFASYSIVLLLAAAVGVRDLISLTSFERRRQARSPIVAAHKAVRDYVAAEGVRRPLIRIDDDRWGDAAGVLLRLLQDGTPVAVTDADLFMFSRAFAATGREDALITFADLDLHRQLRQKPGTSVLLDAFPLFVDAARITPADAGGRSR